MYIVSHDLRAPLLSIKGFSSELELSLKEFAEAFEACVGDMDPAKRARLGDMIATDMTEALRFISSAVVRMDTLITSILTLSRMGRRDLKPERVAMNVLVRGIVDSLGHQIAERRVELRLGDMPDITADKLSLEQIFGNLLDNAVKYLDPQRRGEIEIAAESRADETVFTVRDNGRGIAAEDIPRAFEVFRRVGTQDVPGEGMGLAYVKTLVKRLGGRIWCDSAPGEGTTFSFTIPAVQTKPDGRIP